MSDVAPVRFGKADDEDRSVIAMHRDLLDFLVIDDDAKRQAARLWDILAPGVETAVDAFYASVRRSTVGSFITDENLPRLKQKQKEHWRKLFTSDFDGHYANSVRRAGIRHRDIGLEPTWFIAAYVVLKIEFISLIVLSETDPAEKGRLIKTLEKYVAIDMGLALSTYLAAIID